MVNGKYTQQTITGWWFAKDGNHLCGWLEWIDLYCHSAICGALPNSNCYICERGLAAINFARNGDAEEEIQLT